MKDLSASEAIGYLDYCPETGVFIWKKRQATGRGWNTRYAGHIAGSVPRDGYRYIVINESRYLAHRLAWLIIHGRWPLSEIDHINRIRSDNRICNLREATHAENLRNAPKRLKGLPKGAYWSKKDRSWYSSIWQNGKKKRIGTFATPELAGEAFMNEARKIYGEFASSGE